MGICSSQKKELQLAQQEIAVSKSSPPFADIIESNRQRKRSSTKVPKLDYDNPTPSYNPSSSKRNLGLRDQNPRMDNISESSKKVFQSQRSQRSLQPKQNTNEQDSVNQYLPKPSKFKRQASKASQISIHLPQILLEGIGSPNNLVEKQQNKRVSMMYDVISRNSAGIQLIYTPMTKQYTVVRNSKKKYDYHGETQTVQNNTTGIERIVRALPKSEINSSIIIDKLRNMQLNHPNLIKIIEIYENKDNYYIIEEEPTGGSLYSYIEGKKITENLLAIIMEQILSIISYFHSNNLIHGRLTIHSFSVLDKSPQMKVILTDYLNVFEKQDKFSIANCYLAPENIQNQIASKEGDIWACGIIGVQLFRIQKDLSDADTGDKPINYSTIEELNLTKLGRLIFQQMLRPIPSERGQGSALLKSQWFEIQCSKDLVKKQKLQLNILKKANKLQQKLIAFIIKAIPLSSTEGIFKIVKEELKNEEINQQLNQEQVRRIYQKINKKSLAEQLTDQLFEELRPIDVVDVEFFLSISIPLSEIVTDVNLRMIFQIFDAKEEQILRPNSFAKALGMDIEVVKENMKEILESQNLQNNPVQGFSQVSFRQYIQNIL